MPRNTDIGWPAKAIHEEAEDLKGPLVNLLKETKLYGPVDEPDGVKSVIEATSLAVTKEIEKIAKRVAGGGAVVSLAGGGTVGFNIFDAGTGQQTRVVFGLALLVVGALIVSAAVLGLALVMYGDIRSRASVTCGQLAARADVVNTFLATAVGAAVIPAADEKGLTKNNALSLPGGQLYIMVGRKS